MDLVLDFDGTVTIHDTIQTLAEFGCEQNKSRSKDLSLAWDDVVKAYAEDYANYKNSYPRPEDERTQLDQELNFLRGLRDVELRSLGRVAESGVFKGIAKAAFRADGAAAAKDGRVQLRNGFTSLIDEAIRNDWRVSVVSVNWSGSFVEGVLGHSPIRVFANEVADDGSIVGPLAGSVLASSDDKLRALQRLVSQNKDEPRWVVYIGDSATDLECLLAASRGIVITDDGQSSLMKTLKRIGYDVPHISDVDGVQLAWARDFKEVQESGFVLQGAK